MSSLRRTWRTALYFSPVAESPAPLEIPKRALFKAAEVCELVKVQPYVLRSWEAEFPELGVAKAAGGVRVYRRADVEQVARIKHLLLVEGLTLAGAQAAARRGIDAGRRGCAGHRRADWPERARAADRGEARAAIDSGALVGRKRRS